MRMAKRMLGATLVTVLALAALPAGSPSPVPAAPESASCAPPCGYINPLIDLDFPDKPKCGSGAVVTAERPADCEVLMEDGASVSYPGTIRWYWVVSDEATYPNDPQQPIEIGFSGTSSNPAYLDIRVAPEGFTIDTATLFSPDHFRVVEGPNGQQVYYWYEQPIEVTIARSGAPEGRELEILQDRDGVQNLFLKAKSTASGDRFREAFGVEEFRFDARGALEAATPDGGGTRDTPAFGAALVLALAVVAMLRRR